MARIRKWQEALVVALAATFFSVTRAWPLGTREAASPDRPTYTRELPRIGLLEETEIETGRFGISFRRVVNFQLPFNHLLTHETRQAYGLDCPQRTTNPLKGVILLHGYLW
ncbi:MAG: hypothetical protein ACRD2B_13975 [Terriglobia bacterium]